MTQPAALDPTEVLLGLNNGPGIYLAPEGTAAPADLSVAWASPWEPIGYLSDDGVTVSASTDSDTLTPWQSTAPIRTVITGKGLTMQFVMWQTNPLTLGVYFDTDVPAAVAGVVTFDVRSDAGQQIHAIGLDIKDGDIVTRITFKRASLSDNGDVTLSRGDAVGWDVTLTALDDNGVLGSIISGDSTGGTTTAVEAPQSNTTTKSSAA
jgi:hypothetical protein